MTPMTYPRTEQNNKRPTTGSLFNLSQPRPRIGTTRSGGFYLALSFARYRYNTFVLLIFLEYSAVEIRVREGVFVASTSGFVLLYVFGESLDAIARIRGPTRREPPSRHLKPLLTPRPPPPSIPPPSPSLHARRRPSHHNGAPVPVLGEGLRDPHGRVPPPLHPHRAPDPNNRVPDTESSPNAKHGPDPEPRPEPEPVPGSEQRPNPGLRPRAPGIPAPAPSSAAVLLPPPREREQREGCGAEPG